MAQNALAVVSQRGMQGASTSLEPANFAEAFRLGEVVFNSGIAPKGIRSPEAATMIIMTGRELGLTAMSALRSISMVEGKPTLSADLMAALILQHPKCKKLRCAVFTDTVCTYVARRTDDDPADPDHMVSFTIEQAKRAGLAGKDNYAKWTEDMLRARALSKIARIVFPEVFAGVYGQGEIGPQRVDSDAYEVSSEPARDVPPARPTPAPDSGPRASTSDLERHINALIAQLDGATDTASFALAETELKATMPHLKDHPRRPEVGHAYQAAKRRTATVIVEAPPAPMREPGEEG